MSNFREEYDFLSLSIVRFASLHNLGCSMKLLVICPSMDPKRKGTAEYLLQFRQSNLLAAVLAPKSTNAKARLYGGNAPCLTMTHP